MKYKSICAVVILGAFFTVFPHVVRAEFIDSFISEINIKKDSTAIVTERISYVFLNESHGIDRCIPFIHQDKPSSYLKERYIDIEFQSVSMDAKTVPYAQYSKGNEKCIKIGDPDSVITGAHTYVISYLVGGAVTYEKFGGADWYWNVIGNDWTVPINKVEAIISSEDSIFFRSRSCYQGLVGKNDSCTNFTDEQGRVHFLGTQFNPGEGMTIAQALDQSKITRDIRERYKLVWIFGVVVLICMGWGGTMLYQYKTKFKTGNVIIPQYEPYPGVKPMYAGYLFDKRLDPRDITAGIVYLAQQGFIKIKKIDKKVFFLFEVDDYEIELLKSIEELGIDFEKEILLLIFTLKTDVGAKITLSNLQNSIERSRKNYTRIRKLDTALFEDLKLNSFFTNFFFTRRTRKGYEALDHLKGFKDFLRVTETQRYIFHNAPEKNAEQFMEYLPYAIAFGVEKEWAKTFEGITIPNPDWYDGGGSISHFSAVGLSQSLGGFSTSFASTSGSGGSASSGGGSSGGGAGGGGGGSW